MRFDIFSLNASGYASNIVDNLVALPISPFIVWSVKEVAEYQL